jgi:hypothetical protein
LPPKPKPRAVSKKCGHRMSKDLGNGALFCNLRRGHKGQHGFRSEFFPVPQQFQPCNQCERWREDHLKNIAKIASLEESLMERDRAIDDFRVREADLAKRCEMLDRECRRLERELRGAQDNLNAKGQMIEAQRTELAKWRTGKWQMMNPRPVLPTSYKIGDVITMGKDRFRVDELLPGCVLVVPIPSLPKPWWKRSFRELLNAG